MTITNSTALNKKEEKHTQQGLIHTHTQTRKIFCFFWMDGWISRSAFSLFSFFFWWYDEPKFVCAWTLLYPSSYRLLLHIYYCSSLLFSQREEWAHLVLYTYTSSHINVGRCMKRRIYYIHTQTHTTPFIQHTLYSSLSLSLLLFLGVGHLHTQRSSSSSSASARRFFVFSFVWTRITF